MRLDQLSGWQLMLAQLVALLVVGPALWAIGVAFLRSRTARWAAGRGGRGRHGDRRWHRAI
jgi:hypothetical protein